MKIKQQQKPATKQIKPEYQTENKIHLADTYLAFHK